MHDDAHLCFWFGFEEAEREAFVADGYWVRLQRSDFFDGEYEGRGYGSGSMGCFDDDEWEFCWGVMNESEEIVGSW